MLVEIRLFPNENYSVLVHIWMVCFRITFLCWYRFVMEVVLELIIVQTV
jgi:hypothetical protein